MTQSTSSECDYGESIFCLVVATYSRKASLERLIASLKRAQYLGDAVDLIVSIDGGGPDDVLAFAETIEWPHGQLIVRRHPANLGLRRHIISCGAAVHRYEAVIILEDDLVVGPEFYRYSRWAVDEYQGDSRIAGISLYAPSHNEMADLPFQPMLSSPDVYALQSTQSWGQCWTRRMWQGFETWYEAHGSTLINAPDMPSRIYSWPESSWKKFAMKYLAESGMTWIYPYRSHTTNCSEIGTHNQVESAVYQVGLAQGDRPFVGAPLDDLIHYDIYFERSDWMFVDSVRADPVVPVKLDLYSTRQQVTGPLDLITTRILDQPISQRFGLAFRPAEINIQMATPGKVARRYRLASGQTVDLTRFPVVRPVDFFANSSWRDQLSLGLRGLRNAIARRLRAR